jgi:hypothetical protein
MLALNLQAKESQPPRMICLQQEITHAELSIDLLEANPKPL